MTNKSALVIGANGMVGTALMKVLGRSKTYFKIKGVDIETDMTIKSNTEIIKVCQLLSNSDTYLDKRLLVSGSIIEVCPMRGCWVQIQDDTSQETIRIKVTDGEIVFPLSAVGNKIIAEGDFIKLELSEKQAKNWKQHLALEQGTELDTSDFVLSDKDYYEYRLNSNAAKIF